MIIDTKKNNQRKKSKIKRIILSKKNLKAPKMLQNNIKNLKNFNDFKIIASFLSINSEISTKFLNKFLINNNKILCLPVVRQYSKILVFREYDLTTKLIIGEFGIYEPSSLKNILLPDIILTPCLAFDNRGNRLGYGGGYYDNTFTNLKKTKHKFVSIAVAFDDQKVKEVVHYKNDQKINYILTEKKLYTVK